MSVDYRAAEQGIVGKPMRPINDGALTIGNECDTINGVREVPIASLAPGRRFELVLSATTPYPHKRLRGTLVRKGPGTVAVVLDDAEKQRSFVTAEGSVVVLRQSGGILYWSPGTPVLDIHEARDVSKWTSKGGTGVGEDMHHPANFQSDQIQIDSARLGEKEQEQDMSERVATLPGVKGGNGKTGKTKTKNGKAKGKVRVPKELHPCLCGCGERVTGRFRQGHDGRYYSIVKKVAGGEMAFNEMPKAMQASLHDTAGVKKALRESKH